MLLLLLLQIDILLNNAGLALGTAPVHENSIEVRHLPDADAHS